MIFDKRYVRLFNTDLLEGAKRDGKYGFSTIHSTNARPKKLISFDKAIGSKETDQWVHHYIPDPLFSRFVRDPWRYLPIYQRYSGAISPDFSILVDHPLYAQIQSVATDRAVGSWLQRCGVNVIPNVRWGRKETYEFCFDGIEAGGTVSVGTLGCIRNKQRESFRSIAMGT